MASNVHIHPRGATPPAERMPNETIVKMLREKLERAEAGDIQAIAVADIDRDGFGTTIFHSRGGDHGVLAGFIGLMHRRFLKEWDES